MDQHPIPQDVTGFQFKLIGTMTVKQFGYVAAGAIMAVALYYLPLPPLWLLFKLIFVPIFGASGVVIAFVPIEGRPIDVMTTNFAKALFSPNQYIYRRAGRKLSFSSVAAFKPPAVSKTDPKKIEHITPAKKQMNLKEEQLRAFLQSSQGVGKTEADKKEAAFLKTLTITAPQLAAPTIAKPSPTKIIPTVHLTVSTPQAKPALIAKPISPLQPKPTAPVLPLQMPPPAPVIQSTSPTPTPTPTPETPDILAKKESQLEQELIQAKQEETKPLAPSAHAAAHQKVEELDKQIQEIHSQKQKLEEELTRLQTQLTLQKNPTPPTVPQSPAPVQVLAPSKPAIPIQDPKFVKIVQKTVTSQTDIPQVSDSPNVVVGIVKDPRGNVLSNILVEVKDKDGNPVRAFKTNPLGQFASATPLSPGVYTMELEDPKKMHNFDVIQITANNQIMRPIEIISHDAREALRQQLFAN